jgi:alkanesulfonate monooxygenase SsuD/methylene tetrahydromethanopterin reductase-like flavin-dependent oxidoreductase (luciferase family)
VRIGVMFDTEQPFDEMVGQVASLQEAGIQTAWASQIFAYDALTALAVIGREVPGIDLGTAVVPTYPRHPVMLAAQALTVQAATGGRLTLGIGLSHQMVIEHVFGQSFEKPARHMREYLSILMPLLEGEQVTFAGETLSASTFGPLQIAAPVPPCWCSTRDHHAEDRREDGDGHSHLDDRSGHHRVPHRARPSGRRHPRPAAPSPGSGAGCRCA